MLAECQAQTLQLERQLRSEASAKQQLQNDMRLAAASAAAMMSSAHAASEVAAANAATEAAEINQLQQSTAASAALVQHLRQQVDGQNEQLRRLERLMNSAPAAPPDQYVFSRFDDPVQAPEAKAAPGTAKQPPTLPKEPPVLPKPPQRPKRFRRRRNSIRT